MELGNGDLANRIVTVGSVGRAELIAKNFDADKPVKTFQSNRGFTTFTGYYQGVFCSIVAIGMGPSMMDFFVRESRAIVDGPMAVIRFGTCGGMHENAVPGKVGVASGGSGYVVRNPDAFAHMHDNSTDTKTEPAYHFSKVCPSDPALNEVLIRTITEELGSDIIIEGTNITADSFYSAQGRLDDRFEDNNVDTIEEILKRYPNAVTMEMETFTLLHLARCCHIPIKASAAAIVLANRLTGKVIEGDILKHIEEVGGRAVLQAVATVEFQ